MAVVFEASTPLPPLGNDRRSRAARVALAKKQREAVHRAALAAVCGWPTNARLRAMPVIVVKLTRLMDAKAKRLDDDNLRATFKHVRDGIADFLRRGDSESDGVIWEYEQRRELGSRLRPHTFAVTISTPRERFIELVADVKAHVDAAERIDLGCVDSVADLNAARDELRAALQKIHRLYVEKGTE